MSTHRGPAPLPPTHNQALPLYGPDFWQDPSRTFDRLRSLGPIAPAWLDREVPGWVVTDHNMVIQIERAPEMWTHDASVWNAWKLGIVSDDSELLAMMRPRPNVLFADGKEHARLRRPVAESLAKIDRQMLERMTAHLANQLIDTFAGDGAADLVAQFTDHLPLLLVNLMFGMRPSQANKLVEMLVRIWDGKDAARASEDLERYLGALIARKRRDPGSDVTSWLVHHHANLSSEELVEHLVLIIGAAHAPTAGLIANALMMLLTDQAVRNDLHGNRILAKDVIDLTLWWHTPMSVYPFVYARTDIRVRELTIPAGSAVGLGLAAANLSIAGGRSREQLAGSRAHVSFGAGDHRCPAHEIAHLIATTAVDTILRRLPDIRLAVPEIQWRPSLFMHAPSTLPVTFAPSIPADPQPQGGNSWLQPQRPSSLIPPAQIPTPRRHASTNSAPSWWSRLMGSRRTR